MSVHRRNYRIQSLLLAYIVILKFLIVIQYCINILNIFVRHTNDIKMIPKSQFCLSQVAISHLQKRISTNTRLKCHPIRM